MKKIEVFVGTDITKACRRLDLMKRLRDYATDWHTPDDDVALVREAADRIEALERTLGRLSEHEPSWSDDFLRARAALIGVEATLGGAHGGS